MKKILCGLISLISQAHLLAQGTVTFNGPPVIPSGSAILVQSYYEAGVEFTPIEDGGGFVRQGGGISFYPDNGSDYLQAGSGSNLQFSWYGGGQFGVLSIDLAGYSTVVPDFNVQFIGYFNGGATITTNFSGSGIRFNTYYFGPEWASGLTSVQVPNFGWSMDNLTLPAPEPKVARLFFAGLALVLLRKRLEQRSSRTIVVLLILPAMFCGLASTAQQSDPATWSYVVEANHDRATIHFDVANPLAIAPPGANYLTIISPDTLELTRISTNGYNVQLLTGTYTYDDKGNPALPYFPLSVIIGKDSNGSLMIAVTDGGIASTWKEANLTGTALATLKDYLNGLTWGSTLTFAQKVTVIQDVAAAVGQSIALPEDVWSFIGDATQTISANQFTINGDTADGSVGFRRKPLYQGSDTSKMAAIENTVVLKLSTPISQSVTTVEVKNPDATIFPGSMRFIALNNPLRYSPAIHVSQAGYLATYDNGSGQQVAAPKVARIGYYLGDLGELAVSASLSFQLVDTNGNDVGPAGTLQPSADDPSSWGGTPEYQNVLKADFSSFTTPGTYRLKIPGLGASFPFTIDEGSAMKWARTYALGIYHQRCGAGANGKQVNDLPFTRFVHGDCHTLAAFVPYYDPNDENNDSPNKISVDYHNGRLDDYSSQLNPDNPSQTAPRLSDFNKSLYPFQDTGAKDVSMGHHDAGDYSKYLNNSALLIHYLLFAAENFPGAGALDNLGIPESGDGIGDVLQEAHWEAEFLCKMQDSDGGFYFLVYPEYSEYETAPPNNGTPQVLYPKTTSVSAAAVAALAEMASSPAINSAYPGDVGKYMTAAQNGWNFLISAVNLHGKAGAYQKITHYGDEFTHDDELAWVASAMFAATGDSQYSSKLYEWLPNPNSSGTALYGWWRLYEGWGCAERDYAFAARSGRRSPSELQPTYLADCENEILAAGKDWQGWSAGNAYGTSLPSQTKTVGTPGWYFSTDSAFEIAVARALMTSLGSTDLRYDPQVLANESKALIANLDFQHGCNPVNVAYVTGLGMKRQMEIVDQYFNFPDGSNFRKLPPTGIPLGNLAYKTEGRCDIDELYYPISGDSPCGGAAATGANTYFLYDRWSSVHNVRTEFVTTQSARALAVAAYVQGLATGSPGDWQAPSATIVADQTTVPLNAPVSASLTAPGLDLSGAETVWELAGAPASMGLPVPLVIGELPLEGESVLPNGRRIFGSTTLRVFDPIHGGNPFEYPDPNVTTVALYHFDNSLADAVSSAQNLGPSATFAANYTWMAKPNPQTDKVVRFSTVDDLVTATIPGSKFVNGVNAVPVTVEFHIYVRNFLPSNNPSNPYVNLLWLFQSYNAYMGLQFDGTAPLVAYSAYQSTAFPLTTKAWHSVKMTIAQTPDEQNAAKATVTMVIDGGTPISASPEQSYYVPDPDLGWSFSIGGFDGDIDELRISTPE